MASSCVNGTVNTQWSKLKDATKESAVQFIDKRRGKKQRSHGWQKKWLKRLKKKGDGRMSTLKLEEMCTKNWLNSSFNQSIILFFPLHLQYQNLFDTVISNGKGAVKGREVFGSNDTQIYQMSDLLLIDEIYHLLRLQYCYLKFIIIKHKSKKRKING